MSDTSTPSAPAANVWPIDTIVADALARLRMTPGDDDVARVREAVAVAVAELDDELDRAEPVAPDVAFDAGTVPYLVDAAVQLAVATYQRKDVQFDGTAGIDPPDPVVAVAGQVAAQKARWGVA